MLESTIITENEATPEAVPAQLILRWLFPDPSRPPVPLRQGCRIGRDPDCLVLLDGPGVSRQHAELVRDGAGFLLRDLGSTNGSFCNGQRIAEAAVAPGTLMRIGTWVGLFEQGPSTSATTICELGPGLWGGPVLAAVLEPARRVAPSDLPIVLAGETGTGKEVAARAIHAWSGRRGGFCAINCAALPQHLVEGELFGYRRGAFTGADRNHPGYFRSAHQGTLLLDEVNELSLATQAKLLRVLQEREVIPLGESLPVHTDVRVVVASPAPLERAVAAGSFREDLYMRIAGLELVLPPLRTRIADLPQLFSRFLQQDGRAEAPRLDSKLVESLCLQRWPGNVRQLELTARRLFALYGSEPTLLRSHLPVEMQTAPPAQAGAAGVSGAAGAETQRERELRQLALLLEKHDGKMSRACVEMNISRARGYRLLDGLTVEQLLAKLENKA